ncbi:MAG: MBL fold metallo-hydrolase [Gammaproteobacteria bacterium]|nr:MBL fold metallo-hydrolase [Gammaproteobacteria bacterium]
MTVIQRLFSASLILTGSACYATTPVTNLNTQQLQQQMKNHPETLLIDVRTPQEINKQGTIGLYQNKNIPRGWLEFKISEAAATKDTPIIVYCGQNLRSPLSAKTLTKLGYTNVKNYQDGFFKWQAANLDVNYQDRAKDSLLYNRPVKVVDRVYSAIGAPAPGNYSNTGHNNNLSYIIGDDAVVVFNAGGSYLLAAALHEEIKAHTNLPVKYVVFENAQGHAVLGASYWKAQGATLVGHAHTTDILKANAQSIEARAKRVLKDKFFKSKILLPDIELTEGLKLDVKGVNIQLLHLGPSHSPDDIQLWMPDTRTLISGDIAFNVRMLPILHHTDVKGWINTWDKVEALNPSIIVPGHGNPTDLATITHYTKDYLVFLRTEILKVLDNGGDLVDALAIDQSAFSHFKTYNELHKQNVDRLYQVMEFEE